MLYNKGVPMMFTRGDQEPSPKLKGMLSVNQIREIIKGAQSALKMGISEIYVNS